MFLQANPDRARSDEEKQNIARNYKPGDNVVPKVRLNRDPEEEEARRIVEEVQELSLREAGISREQLDVPENERRARSLESRHRSHRHRHTAATINRSPGGTYLNYRPDRDSSDRSSPQQVSERRQVEHQASLRSLLSASDVDSQEIEEEIMRQIMEEGLLDGIDLANIDVSQEDEITERIAQAYRRRQRQRERERERDRDRDREREHRHSRRSDPDRNESAIPRERQGSGSSPSSAQRQDEDRAHRNQNTGSESSPRESSHTARRSARPPVSRPHLFEAGGSGSPRERRHRRSASQGSSRGSTPGTPRAGGSRRRSEDAPAAATRSSTEPSSRPRTAEGEEGQSPSSQRGATGEEFRDRDETRITSTRHTHTGSQSSPRQAVGTASLEIPSSNSQAAPLHLRSSSQHSLEPPQPVRRQPITNHSSPALVTLPSHEQNREPRPDGTVSSTRSAPFIEPAVACKRCGVENIQYDLHFNCAKCDEGQYNICLRCYRASRGCRHWYGFGYAAWTKYERQAPPGGYPPGHEKPHVLTGHRYVRPRHDPVGPISNEDPHFHTDDDPARRLRAGVFCDICLAFANACYWRCDFCNEGAWGFCNNCVNQGRHCTHPLLPLTHKGSQAKDRTSSEQPWTDGTNSDAAGAGSSSSPTVPSYLNAVTPKSASLIRGPATTPITIGTRVFRPLTFSVNCDNCRYPIPPSNTRFHCQVCSAGDFDLCKSCYHGMVATGRIAVENGHNGWRRCPRGHRMIVVGFEDRDGGQRRVVVNDLVGGLALKEDGDAATSAGESASSLASQQQQQQHHLAPPISSAQRASANRWSWRDGNTVVQKSRGHEQHPSPNASSQSTGSSSTNAPGPSTNTNTNTALAVPGARPPRQRFPPDGGIGLHVVALWGYFPADAVSDELMFPKGAEIREVEDINGDWFWGCYAGAKGLFPGNYGRVVG